MDQGWPADLPVAAIENGATPSQRVLRSTLSQSARVFRAGKLAAPAVTVVGRVAALADRLNWVTKERPLFGRRIVVTRAAESNDRLAALLDAEGVESVICPLIRVRPLNPPLLSTLRSAPAEARMPYDWLIFLSANAVRLFVSQWPEAPRRLRHVGVVAVGPQTAAAATNAGFLVNRMPDQFRSGAVRRVLGKVRGCRVLLPRARVAPPGLVASLSRAGATVDVLPIYETEFLTLTAASRGRLESGVDAVTFLSASSVEAFVRAVPKSLRRRVLKSTAIVSIGPATSAAIRRFLKVRPLEAEAATMESLISVLRRHFAVK